MWSVQTTRRQGMLIRRTRNIQRLSTCLMLIPVELFPLFMNKSRIHQAGVIKLMSLEQGAGDQGMMFGYACEETDDYMPLASDLSHLLLQELSKIRKERQGNDLSKA